MSSRPGGVIPCFAYRDAYAAIEWLAAILGSSPAFFERLILRLMIALGYGNKGAEQHLGRSGDG